MALFGGVAHAPLAVMLMVAEMTGNLAMLAPAMVAVGARPAWSAADHLHQPAPEPGRFAGARFSFAMPLLAGLTAQDTPDPRLVLRASMDMASAEARLGRWDSKAHRWWTRTAGCSVR